MRPGLIFLVRAGIARRSFRSAVIVAVFAALAALMATAALVDRAGRAGLDRGLRRLGADLVAVPRGLDDASTRAFLGGRPPEIYMDGALEKKLAAFPFVRRTSAQVFVRSLPSGSCCSAHSILLVGFDPATDFTVRPWLTDPDLVIAPDQALLGAAFDATAGDTVRFFGHVFRVAGRLDPTSLGLDSAVFLPMATVRQMATPEPGKLSPLGLPPGAITAVAIKLKPESAGGLPAYRAAYELEMAVPEVSVLQPDELLVKTQRNLSRALATLRAGSYAVWPLTTLLAGLVFALAARERAREIGLLRAMGAQRSFVFGLVLLEALILSAVGAAIGLASATAGAVALARWTAGAETPVTLPGAAELAPILSGAAALTMAAGAAAALYPAARAARLEPYEALRRDG